jgi:recombination protein RecA
MTDKKDSFIEKMKKKYGENSFKSIFDQEPLEVVSSGSLSVDYVSGVGGLPRGMISIFEGEPSAGKTELALDACKAYQDLYPLEKICYIDVEKRLTKDRVLGRNIDPHRFELGRKAIAEKVFDLTCDVVTEKNYGLVVIDSISMLTPESDLEKKLEDQTKPATQAVALQKGFRKLGAIMMEENSKCVVIMINQLQSNIGAKQWESKVTGKSGFAPKYLSSFTIRVERLMGKERIEKDETGHTVSNEIKLTCIKNSLSHIQHRKSTFVLNYAKGPVLSSELINLGIGYGLITKANNVTWEIHPSDTAISVRGYDNLVKKLDTDQDLALKLKHMISEKIKNGDLTIEVEAMEE